MTPLYPPCSDSAHYGGGYETRWPGDSKRLTPRRRGKKNRLTINLVALLSTWKRSRLVEKRAAPTQPLLGDRVSIRDNGWFINGHLLLTYEGDFYHADHMSRSRSGAIIGEGMSSKAYEQAVPDLDGEVSRSITIDGEQRRLTDSEVEFITKALWAVENTPDQR